MLKVLLLLLLSTNVFAVEVGVLLSTSADLTGMAVTEEERNRDHLEFNGKNYSYGLSFIYLFEDFQFYGQLENITSDIQYVPVNKDSSSFHTNIDSLSFGSNFTWSNSKKFDLFSGVSIGIANMTLKSLASRDEETQFVWSMSFVNGFKKNIAGNVYLQIEARLRYFHHNDFTVDNVNFSSKDLYQNIGMNFLFGIGYNF